MFTAILKGKAARTTDTISSGTRWRDVLRKNEDLLTATVFERLGYLPDSLTWEVLSRTYKELTESIGVSPDGSKVLLKKISYWPTWPDLERDEQYAADGNTVEPDVILEFEEEKTQKSIVLCIEVKTGGAQYQNQWSRQIRAIQAMMEEGGEFHEAECWFLGVGGFGGSATISAKQISKDIGMKGIKVGGAHWRELSRCVAKIKTEVTAVATQRVLSDISDALELWGYRHIDFSVNWPKPAQLNYHSSIKALREFP